MPVRVELDGKLVDITGNINQTVYFPPPLETVAVSYGGDDHPVTRIFDYGKLKGEATLALRGNRLSTDVKRAGLIPRILNAVTVFRISAIRT